MAEFTNAEMAEGFGFTVCLSMRFITGILWEEVL
jgi:hypothetical protein